MYFYLFCFVLCCFCTVCMHWGPPCTGLSLLCTLSLDKIDNNNNNNLTITRQMPWRSATASLSLRKLTIFVTVDNGHGLLTKDYSFSRKRCISIKYF